MQHEDGNMVNKCVIICLLLLLHLLALHCKHAQGKSMSVSVFIDNTSPKLDISGNIVNAHDGTYRYHDGYYYYHGAEYGLCKEPAKNGCDQTPDHCGFHADHNVSIYRSPDLSSGSWERVGTAVQCRNLENCGILYRPHLVYNPGTQMWVLFVNYVEKDGGYGGNAVYSAPHPAGPFALQTQQMALTRLCPGPANPDPKMCGPTQGGCGDFDVFVDDDGSGYIVYGCNFYMSIEPLTPTFYDSSPTGKNATGPDFKFNGTVFPDYFVEAPTLFKRRDTYYLLYGHCCCFCYQGSGILVYTSKSIGGPWVAQEGGDLACEPSTSAIDFHPSSSSTNNIDIETILQGNSRHGSDGAKVRVTGTPTPGQGCLYNGSTDVSSTHAQQNFVVRLPDTNDASQFLWTGDLWQQSPDGLKGHEGQYWTLLEFDDASGKIGKVKHIDNFTMDVPNPAAVAMEVDLKTFDVLTYGAIGDGIHDDTKAIAKAMEAAAVAPPSTVLFPKGKVFLSGPINMSHSDLTLQVEGVLKAKSGNNTKDGIAGWPQIPPLPSYGDSRDGPYLQFQAFLYSVNTSNLKIAGNGTIDGSGNWWWYHQRNRTLIPSGRPNLVQLVNVDGIEVTGVTLKDSPFWCLHPVYSRNIHIHHIKIRSRMYAPNSDGVDPDSCQNVMIENNDISTGDDGIAIKAGVCGASSPNDCVKDVRFSDGTFQTRNVTVRYNTFRIGMGISVGSESSGGIRDVYIHDNIVGLCEQGHCLDKCCGWGPGLHLKTALTRGQEITNIIFSRNKIINNTGFIDMETNYQSGDTPPVGYKATVVSNIVFDSNSAVGGATGATFSCSKVDTCHNITITNNTVANSDDPWNCKYIASWTAKGNTGEEALEKCLQNSLTG